MEVPLGSGWCPSVCKTRLQRSKRWWPMSCEYIHDFALVYLKDVIIYLRRWEEYLLHLALVLECRSWQPYLTVLLEKATRLRASIQLKCCEVCSAWSTGSEISFRDDTNFSGHWRTWSVPIRNGDEGPNQQGAFLNVKRALMKPLQLPNSKRIAAVFLQQHQEGQRIISYAIAKLTPTEQR